MLFILSRSTLIPLGESTEVVPPASEISAPVHHITGISDESSTTEGVSRKSVETSYSETRHYPARQWKPVDKPIYFCFYLFYVWF